MADGPLGLLRCQGPDVTAPSTHLEIVLVFIGLALENNKYFFKGLTHYNIPFTYSLLGHADVIRRSPCLGHTSISLSQETLSKRDSHTTRYGPSMYYLNGQKIVPNFP